ncbi:hypothetical protein [Roseospira visakhapatnamensis]|uniref:Uncharacterized protein n=1 Tax=Roseospira visakhapatnamensis TaxID=390880 RepID=A0A7W6RFW5_9PROT|nr:hypothetical protein [Roseospira visakhapatnamensis]MBB4267835.1 hypothetical protein [Roseospira visakhapatnamensis]
MAQTGAQAESVRPQPLPSLELPFIREIPDKGVWSCWHVEPTGDYRMDCELGRALAWRTVEYLRRHASREGTLSQVLADMIAAGRADGVEIGFAQGLAEAITGRTPGGAS